LIGFMGNSLTRLDPMLEYGFGRLARENRAVMTPQAAIFYPHGQFSAVRTLSPENPALIALSELPIEVPYHSVIGQHHPGRKEAGSDGVVPYWSSHLAGAQSEVIVRSGHAVITNLDAVRETIRILHLELIRSRIAPKMKVFTMSAALAHASGQADAWSRRGGRAIVRNLARR
jgi:hypothetical protein